jgi:hypothetical protein
MSGMYFNANSKRATIQFNTREYKKAYHNEMFLKKEVILFFLLVKTKKMLLIKDSRKHL